MKLSKLRKQARDKFRRGSGLGRIKYRTEDGVIHDAEPWGKAFVAVTIIRGRAFTQDECRRRYGG